MVTVERYLPVGRTFSDIDLKNRYGFFDGSTRFDKDVKTLTVDDCRRILILEIEGFLQLSLTFKRMIHAAIQKKLAKRRRDERDS